MYFPSQLNLENAKNSLDVEGPHHYNIFFWVKNLIMGWCQKPCKAAQNDASFGDSCLQWTRVWYSFILHCTTRSHHVLETSYKVLLRAQQSCLQQKDWILPYSPISWGGQEAGYEYRSKTSKACHLLSDARVLQKWDREVFSVLQLITQSETRTCTRMFRTLTLIWGCGVFWDPRGIYRVIFL